MPTVVTYDIGSGQTHANATAALSFAATDAALGGSGDLVASDTIARFVVHTGATQETQNWSPYLNNTFTTSATNRLEFVAAAADRHAGDYTDTNVARLFWSAGFTAGADTALAHVLIDGLYIENNGFSDGFTYGAVVRPNGRLLGCIVVAPTAMGMNGGIIDSCLLITERNGSRGIDAGLAQASLGGGLAIRSNTIIAPSGSTGIGLDIGDRPQTVDLVLSDNAVFDFDTGYARKGTSNPPAATIENNASDVTVFGTGHQVITTADFEDYANDDFTPATGGDLDGTGVDLSADFTTDLLGNTRTTPWEIGAIALVGAAGITFSGDVDAGAAEISATVARTVAVTSTPMQGGPASITAQLDIVNIVTDGSVAAGGAEVAATTNITRQVESADVAAGDADVTVTAFVVDGTVDVTDGNVAAGVAEISVSAVAITSVTDGNVAASPADISSTFTRTIFVVDGDVEAGNANVSAAVSDGSFTVDAYTHGNAYGEGIMGVA